MSESNEPTEETAAPTEARPELGIDNSSRPEWTPRRKPATYGYDPEKDKDLIADLNRWYTCSLCGLGAEVRPHAPMENQAWRDWPAFPIRLCFYCAAIQEAIRERIRSYDLQDGN